MEESLLGPEPRSNSLFSHGLFKIEKRDLEETEASSTYSSDIRQKLIFGSPHAGSSTDWIDSSSIHEQIGTEHEGEPLISTRYQDVCTCGHAEQSDAGGNSHANGPHMNTQIKRSHKSEPSLMDLDLKSPWKSFSSSPIATWFLGENGATIDHEKRWERFFRTMAMPQGSVSSTTTKHCVVCKRCQLAGMQSPPALAGQGSKESLEGEVVLAPTLSVVSQAFIGLLLYLAVGVFIYTWKEDDFSGSSTHYFVDAIYFCIVTLCTIGYGDITPRTPTAKLFSCGFVLVGFGFIDVLLMGMVTYVLDRQEALLLSAVAAGQHEAAKNYLVDLEKGRMRIRSKVTLALGVVISCIGVGTLVIHFLESMGWLDSLYLSCMSVTTVGYGDHAFKTMWGRVFASVWLLVSTLAVARSFLYLAEARIDKRHRLIAKLVLEKEMTIGELFAADFDHDGCVSKSDFVVYKLKQMGKVLDKDIVQICKQFSRLDADKSGKISLSCLINLHEASSALR